MHPAPHPRTDAHASGRAAPGGRTVDDGLAIALPYGPGCDGVRNVLAAGAAVIGHEGRTITISRPTVVSGPGADAAFGDTERRIHRLFGIDDVLLLYAEVPAVHHDARARRRSPLTAAVHGVRSAGGPAPGGRGSTVARSMGFQR